MENLKIRVNSEAESKEVQELFFELGYKWNNVHGYFDLSKYPNIIRGHNTSEMTQSIESDILYKECKEITLPQLRDMVVLKRNSIDDATHTDGHYSFYVGKDKNYFFYSCDKAWRGTWKNVDILKPIEKTMKECLRKGESDISYRQYLMNFIVGNRTESLNDQYAEIETVRHNHYFKDVSDVNRIDVYEVLKRFNVTDPCLQHIIKKALCAGQRGHKDFKNDLQDILDTAKRAVEINK